MRKLTDELTDLLDHAPHDWSFATRAIHAGEALDPATGALGVPLYQNVTYGFSSAEQVEAAEAGLAPRHFYSRETNPTVRCLELKLANLEGAADAVATASGMAAIHATMMELVPAGAHLVASDALYSYTRRVLECDLPAWGATVSFADSGDAAAIAAAITSDTRAIYVETFSNPTLRVADIPGIAAIASERDITLIVDNTFLSPALARPLEHGATVVIHSTTKYISGHGNAIGGFVNGPKDLIDRVRARLIRTGGSMAAFPAWLTLTGAKTLPLRSERHCQNAARLATLMAAHPAVATVHYPGLVTDPGHAIARRLVGAKGSAEVDPRYGGMVSVRLHGGVPARRLFLNALTLPTIAVSLGECETLVWPYSGSDLIRVSVGLEDADDLARDVERALDAVGRV